MISEMRTYLMVGIHTFDPQNFVDQSRSSQNCERGPLDPLDIGHLFPGETDIEGELFVWYRISYSQFSQRKRQCRLGVARQFQRKPEEMQAEILE